MSRLEDARHERKLLVDLRENPAWKFYAEKLRERIQLRMNDMIQPPIEGQACNLKEFISGEINGLVQAKDTTIERLLEVLNEEIEQLSDGKDEADGREGHEGDGVAADSDQPLGFGVETSR